MEYIDLGLPSGTKWAEKNEEGYYTFDEAVAKYGDNMPTYEQFEELQAKCRWEWIGNGYRVTGPNGNSIILLAEGIRVGNDNVRYVGSYGDYWSSTLDDSYDAWGIGFDSSNVDVGTGNRYGDGSVRLVKSKNKDNNMKDKEINIAEILKDCPEGTPLYSPIFGNVTFQCINHHNDIYPIMVNVPPHTSMFTKYGRYTDESGGECLLFPSKENRDWSTFNVRQNFKKGDFVARVYEDEYFLLLMDDTDWRSSNNRVKVICYVSLYNNTFYVSKPTDFWCNVSSFCTQGSCRLATDDEKAKLLDAIDKHGYVWDEEKLELRKKECPNFKKGDFVTRVHDGKSTILLMGDTDWSSPSCDVKYICLLNLSNDRFHVSEFIIDYWCTIKEFYEQDGYSLATDDEKKKLLDAIDKHGYVWDEEKLELRKKEYEFKPFDKVLVRDTDINCWTAGFFSHCLHDVKTECRLYAVNGVYYKKCIPYEGNEHLLGTCNNPDEKGCNE